MVFEKKRILRAQKRFLSDIKKLPRDIKEESILLIGPMGTGKSTISELISQKLKFKRISLDNRNQLQSIYIKRNKFKNFKNFEFILTGLVLSSLKEPSIIDFGAGHSIYEDNELREKMNELCSEFSNIVLLLPSKNKDESRRILLGRRNILKGSNQDKDNWHFITAPNNEELATYTLYEEEKTLEEIMSELLELRNKQQTKDEERE